ncbi:MAG TPA: DUF4845 domain-containing protein [Pseudomonadales bacterium]|nr:DUF4845 domain-containing protein [Pseudomonadales bacterium]
MTANRRSKQGGASFLSWIVIAAMVSAIGLIAARLAPAYVDYRTICTLIDALPADKVHTMTKTEIRDSLQKRFLINNIRDLDSGQIIDIDHKRDHTVLTLKYEVRQPLIYNISIVVAFDREFDFT